MGYWSGVRRAVALLATAVAFSMGAAEPQDSYLFVHESASAAFSPTNTTTNFNVAYGVTARFNRGNATMSMQKLSNDRWNVIVSAPVHWSDGDSVVNAQGTLTNVWYLQRDGNGWQSVGESLELGSYRLTYDNGPWPVIADAAAFTPGTLTAFAQETERLYVNGTLQQGYPYSYAWSTKMVTSAVANLTTGSRTFSDLCKLEDFDYADGGSYVRDTDYYLARGYGLVKFVIHFAEGQQTFNFVSTNAETLWTNTGGNTDFNADGAVDAADATLLAADLGATGSALDADLNADNLVDVRDLVILLQQVTP